MLTTEFTLLLELCRFAFGSGEHQRLRTLGESADWQRLVRLARFHRVQGLAAHALHSSGLAPQAEREALSADAETIVATSLRQARECGEILASAAERGIPVLFLKGLTVGTLAYGNPFLKMGWDIDLLVDRNDVARSAELLRSRGFQLAMPDSGHDLESWHRRHKESVWARPDDGVHVELHTRLADNPRLIGGIDVHSPARAIEIAPEITLQTLAADELFAYLSVHGASSAWFRLKWITDLAALLSCCSPPEIERLYARSQQLGAARAAGQALLVGDALYGTLSGSGLGESLRGERATAWLAREALRQLAGTSEPVEPTRSRLGTWRIHLTQLFLRPGLGFKIGEFSRQVGSALS